MYTKKDKTLVRSLLLIRDKGNCAYTHWRAVQEFNKIKYDLANKIGSGYVIALAYDLLDIDPDYPDSAIGNIYAKDSFSTFINAIICKIAPQKEALKYMRECHILSHFYEDFDGYEWSAWRTVDRCYKYSPWPKIRHDDKKTAKWREFNNY